MLESCLNKIRENKHNLGAANIIQDISTIDGYILEYRSKSYQDERWELGHKIYKCFNKIVCTLSEHKDKR